MDVEWDPDKDAANVAKHGVSLMRVAEMVFVALIRDERFASEPRFRAYGYLDGKPHCAALTLRGDRVRAISFRRAHAKEFRRHAG